MSRILILDLKFTVRPNYYNYCETRSVFRGKYILY